MLSSMNIPESNAISESELAVTQCTTRLTACRQEMMVLYTSFLKTLQVVRQDSMDLTSDLEAIGASCAEVAETGKIIHDMWQRTHQLIGGMKAAQHMLKTHGSHEHFWAATQAVDQIEPCARQLSAVASLTSISAASMDTGGLSHHVELMRHLAVSLKANCDVMGACIQDINIAVEGARVLLNDSSIFVSALHGELEKSMGLASNNGTLGDMSIHIGRASQELLDTTKQQLRDLIGCMQFSDAFVQRIDHLVEMLDGQMPGAGHIAAVQLNAIIDDQRDNSIQARIAIDNLLKVSQDANHILEQDSCLLDEAIAQNDAALSMATHTGIVIKETIRDVLAQLSQIEPANASAQGECNSLNEILGQIDMSAKNVSLKAKTNEDARNAVTVLAREVQEIASQTSDRLEEVKQLINKFQTISNDKSLNELVIIVEDFTEITGICTTLKSSIQQLLDQKVTLRGRSRKLSESTKIAEECLQRLVVIDEALAREKPVFTILAAQSEKPSEEENLKIYDLYTMERERDIHKTVFAFQENTSTVQGETDLDDDDFETF